MSRLYYGVTLEELTSMSNSEIEDLLWSQGIDPEQERKRIIKMAEDFLESTKVKMH